MKLPKVLDFEPDTKQSGTFSRTNNRVRNFKAHVTDLIGAEDSLYKHDKTLQYGQSHPANDLLQVSSFQASLSQGGQREGDRGWPFQVVVSYSSEVQAIVDNPLKVSADIETSTITTRRIVTKDYEGNPLVNKAGQLIEGVEDEVDLVVFSITKNIPPRFPKWLLKYPRRMNSDAVTIDGLSFKPKTLQVGRLRIGKRQTLNKKSFRTVSMDVVHNPETWERKLLNAGTMEFRYRELSSVGAVAGGLGTSYEKVLRPILNDSGEPVTEPQPLTKDGDIYRVDKKTGKVVPLEKQKGFFVDDLQVKSPLDPKDLITLSYTLKKPLPFNGVLPLT